MENFTEEIITNLEICTRWALAEPSRRFVYWAQSDVLSDAPPIYVLYIGSPDEVIYSDLRGPNLGELLEAAIEEIGIE